MLNFAVEIKIRDMILYLKEAMKAKGITSVELAGRVGVSKTMVSYWLSGKNFPTPENIEAIAVALGIPVWQLFVSPESTKEARELAIHETVAFFYHKGKPTIPATVDQIMPILREWNDTVFHTECYRYTFDRIRQRYADMEAIQKLMDSLCALLRENGDPYYVCKNNNTKNTEQ